MLAIPCSITILYLATLLDSMMLATILFQTMLPNPVKIPSL
jgi:hypothetical protein